MALLDAIVTLFLQNNDAQLQIFRISGDHPTKILDDQRLFRHVKSLF